MLIANALASWKGEEDICSLVRAFGVASADPAPGLELVVWSVPVTGSLSGLASTEAWGHGVGGGPLRLWSNSEASDGIQSPSGEIPQLYLEPLPSVLCFAQGAGRGAPSLPLLLTHVAQGEYQQTWDRRSNRSCTSPSRDTACSSGFPATSPSLSPRHSSPQDPCHAILCPDVPRESSLLEDSLPSSGQGLLSMCCFLVFL